jgi:hypothetical protein
MIGGILGGGGKGGPLGGLMEILNPAKMLEKLMKLPQMLQGLLGGGGAEGKGGGGGGPLDLLKQLDPMALISGLLGGAQSRGL